MKRLLDTNICIYLINRKPAAVLRHLEAARVGDLGLSSITVAELLYGAAKSQYPDRNRQALEKFLLPLEIAPFDMAAATAYGPVRANLEHAGRLIGPLDLLIAAHALSLGVKLVTNNIREFERVPGLRVEAWT